MLLCGLCVRVFVCVYVCEFEGEGRGCKHVWDEHAVQLTQCDATVVVKELTTSEEHRK